MSKKISKISKLKNIESFLQINYLKGFKYIDSVGEILNDYQNEYGEISYNMSPERVIIPTPTIGIEEIKISTTDLWCHFVNPKNLGECERLFTKEADKLLNILKVENIVRVGWRSYYVYELTNKITNLNSLCNLKSGNTQELTLTVDLKNDFKASVRIKLLKQKVDTKIVVLFDIDVYDDNKKVKDEALRTFKNLRTEIEGEMLLDFLNECILKLDK